MKAGITIRTIAIIGAMLSFAPAYANANDSSFIQRNYVQSEWELGGWVDAGIYVNSHGQKNSYTNGQLDMNSGNTGRYKNVKQSDLQANQMWIYLEKKVDENAFSIGGRVDFMYGTDGRHFQADGLDHNASTGRRWGEGDYYAALPQMYAEIGTKKFNVKVGKFFTPMGLDSSCAPNRFFYSTSYENQTYWDFAGALATWEISPKFSVYGGWVNGEGTFFNGSDKNGFLGGFGYKFSDRFRLDYSLLSGKDDNVREYYVQSLTARMNVTKRFDYNITWMLRNEESDRNSSIGWGRYGINQEMFYHINRCWSLGFGIEWMNNYSDVDTFDNYDVYSLRFGANWKPTKYFTLKPEIRYDHYNDIEPFNITKSNGLDPKDSQWNFGISGVLTF